MFNRRGGFTYIEVIICAAVLSVVFIPVMQGFHSASAAYTRAADMYRAGAQAELALAAACRFVGAYGADIAETDISAVLNDDYLLFDEYDFTVTVRTGSDIISTESSAVINAAELILTEPAFDPEPLYGGWIKSGGTDRTYTRDGVVLILGAYAAPPDTVYTITVDVRDKQGVCAVRAGRVLRC